MPLLFQSTAGRVVQLQDPAAACQTQLYSMTPAVTYDVERSIVTRLTMSHKVNAQFLHTIGSQIFVYVFGDRIGSLSLSGLSFTCPCDDFLLGAEEMYSWYKRNRASKRREPVRVTIGGTTIEGFVMEFTEDVVDPATSLTQWGVNMLALPEDL